MNPLCENCERLQCEAVSGGEFAGQGLVGDEAAAPGSQAAVDDKKSPQILLRSSWQELNLEALTK